MSGPIVYLCEKPDQARKIAQAIGKPHPKDGHILANGNSIVTWAFGHLFMQKMPEDYNEELKYWKWDTLPIIPKPFEYKARDGSVRKQIKIINDLLKKASMVVVSTDADREGELIAYEILTQLRYNGPIKRLWLSDLTLPAIQKALANLRDGSETKPLYHAALARSCADWLVGMNMSRAATLKLRQGPGKPLSIGRVQTPTLALMVKVERKIRDFKPEDYFELVADIDAESGHSVRMRFAPKLDERIVDRQKIDALAALAAGATGPISVKTEARKKAPPPLFDLNLLQQACNARFGWSADHTLKIAQALYETHQVATYPRTDCTFLPDEHRKNIAAIMGNLLALNEFSYLKSGLAKPIERKTVYDDKKITAHHAIVPTSKAADLSRLNADERRLYLLIARHYLAAHMADHEYDATTMSFDANGVLFLRRGTQPTFAGWKDAFGAPGSEDSADSDEEDGKDGEDENENATLPPIKDGEPGTARHVEVQAKQTKPPQRFTEKTLLQAMKNVAAYVDDPEAKKRLKQTSGIGTSATRGNIIETLKQRGFITVQKRKLVPTETGMTLIDAIEKAIPDYADPAQTAAWEDALESIVEGKIEHARFISAIAGKVTKDLNTLRARQDLVRIAADQSARGGQAKPSGGRDKGNGKSGVAKGHSAGSRMNDDQRRAMLEKGTRLSVPFNDREEAKKLGARWNPEAKVWVAPPGADLEPFRKAGFLAA
jgi:DNA topoisomerase-3